MTQCKDISRFVVYKLTKSPKEADFCLVSKRAFPLLLLYVLVDCYHSQSAYTFQLHASWRLCKSICLKLRSIYWTNFCYFPNFHFTRKTIDNKDLWRRQSMSVLNLYAINKCERLIRSWTLSCVLKQKLLWALTHSLLHFENWDAKITKVSAWRCSGASKESNCIRCVWRRVKCISGFFHASSKIKCNHLLNACGSKK